MAQGKIRLFLTASAFCLFAAAQSGPPIGISRFGNSKAFGFGSVDHADLNSHLEIPIFNRATAGDAQIHLRLTYDSQFWRDSTGAWKPASGAGWQLMSTGGFLSATLSSRVCGELPNRSTVRTTTYVYTEPDGSSASPLALITFDGCSGNTSSPGNYPISDGKGFTYVVASNLAVTVTDANGNLEAGGGAQTGFTDRNGNRTYQSSSGGTTSYINPLGTAVQVTSPSASETDFAYIGPGQISYATVVKELWETLSVSTSLGCGLTEFSGSLAVPSELDLPNGASYKFGYDGNGRLASVTLPTGGVVSYAYTIDCSDLGNSSLTRSTNAASGGTWNWSRTHPSGEAAQTTESDPEGDSTVYTYPSLGGTPATIASFDSTPKQLKSISNAVTSNSGGVSEIDTTTEIFGSPNLFRLSTLTLDSFGKPVVATDYDWNTSPSVGVLLRKIINNNVVESNGFTDDNDGVEVDDVNGQVSKAVYGRDANGNINQITETVAGAQTLVKQMSYNANGTVATVTDVNGAVTSFTYGACNGNFPSEVKGPIPAALDTTMTWDCNGGVMTQSKDVNGSASSFAFSDPLWHPTSTTNPDGSVTSITYLPNSVERVMNFNGGVSADDVLTTLDGLGNPVLQQRRQAPGSSSFDTVATFYDGMGRPAQVTAPCVESAGTACPVGSPGTTTEFDALSRPITFIDGGSPSGRTTYNYVGNDVLTTLTSPTISRQQEFDGLNRLSSVCEITSTLPGNGKCAQISAQTGYWTQYTRNGAGQITKVVQNAQGSPTQPRTFSFDELGRLTSENNPESGTTSYVFDAVSDPHCSASSPGDLVERTDANGNVTCYQHDAIHRVTQITYPSGPNAAATPTKTFVYDAATVDGAGMANAGGRLAEAYTGPGGARATDLGFSYSGWGEVAAAYQMQPGGANWYVANQSFYAAGVVATLTAPTLNGVSFGLDGEGRPNAASVNGVLLEGTVTHNAAGQVTSIALPSGDGDSYGYDPNTGRMNLFTFQVGGNTNQGAPTWNANGTLATLQLTDQIPNTGNSQTCNYTHDDLGRLAAVACDAWQQTFTTDPFGNVSYTGTPQSFQAGYVDGSGKTTNRIATNTQFAPNYDADGDPATDPVYGTANGFDAEGRATTLDGVAVVYDALGRAVEAGGREFVYGPNGGKLAVMNGPQLVRADIPLPGGAEAEYGPSGLVGYRHPDWLGSSRLVSSPQRTALSSTAYAPFSQPYDETGQQDRDFTGIHQDIANATYDFPLRELSSLQARWWTPDPLGLAAVDPSNPQTWNRYAYVGNQPLMYTDPLGLEAACSEDATQPCNMDPIGCTEDGMDVGCSSVQQQSSLLGGGGMVACPDNDCGGTFDWQGHPYDLEPGANGWTYTNVLNGADLSINGILELGLPDLNNQAPPGSWLRQNDLPAYSPLGPLGHSGPWVQARQTQSFQPSHSYASFLACEYGQTVANEDHLGTWAFLNGSAFAALSVGAIKKGLTLAAVAIFYDFSEGYAIRTACTAANY